MIIKTYIGKDKEFLIDTYYDKTMIAAVLRGYRVTVTDGNV